MHAKAALLSDLRAKGFRLTPQREKIIDIFYALPAGEHLSAEDLYQQLKAEKIDISLATSYRTLKLLASVGVLREVEFSDDSKQYELLREGEVPHHHLICATCNLAVEFDSPEIQAIAEQVAKLNHFELQGVEFKVFAECTDEKVDCPLKQPVEATK